MKPRMFKVSDIATAAGVTVRTLHHYEEIGLLPPAHRSDAGHRLYDHDDLQRLQQILALRQLGFPLDAIGSLLRRPEMSPAAVIRMQLARLGEQIDALEGMRQKLESAAGQLERDGRLTTDQLLQLVDAMQTFEKHYSKEQLEQLAQRREQMGDDAIQAAQDEWARLIADARAALDAGTPVSDPEVQRIARRWQELIAAFTGGDAGIERSLQNGWNETMQNGGSAFGIDRSLMDYVGRAMAALPR